MVEWVGHSLPSFRLPASVSLFLSWKFEAERVSTAYAALYCMAGPAHPARALSLGTSEVSSRQQQVLLRPGHQSCRTLTPYQLEVLTVVGSKLPGEALRSLANARLPSMHLGELIVKTRAFMHERLGIIRSSLSSRMCFVTPSKIRASFKIGQRPYPASSVSQCSHSYRWRGA
jgi:hypothetical protein